MCAGVRYKNMESARSATRDLRYVSCRKQKQKNDVSFKAYGSTYQTRQGGYDSGGFAELLPPWLVVLPWYDCEYHIAPPLRKQMQHTWYSRVRVLFVHFLCCALIRDASWSTREQWWMMAILACLAISLMIGCGGGGERLALLVVELYSEVSQKSAVDDIGAGWRLSESNHPTYLYQGLALTGSRPSQVRNP